MSDGGASGNLIEWAAAAVTALFGWVLRRQVSRIDAHSGRITKLEKEAVDEDRLERTITRIEQKIDQSRKETREDIGRLHDRLDEVMKR